MLFSLLKHRVSDNPNKQLLSVFLHRKGSRDLVSSFSGREPEGRGGCRVPGAALFVRNIIFYILCFGSPEKNVQPNNHFQTKLGLIYQPFYLYNQEMYSSRQHFFGTTKSKTPNTYHFH